MSGFNSSYPMKTNYQMTANVAKKMFDCKMYWGENTFNLLVVKAIKK